MWNVEWPAWINNRSLWEENWLLPSLIDDRRLHRSIFPKEGGGGSFESDLIWKEAVEKKEEAIPFISADVKNISSWKYVLRNRQWENKYW